MFCTGVLGVGTPDMVVLGAGDVGDLGIGCGLYAVAVHDFA